MESEVQAECPPKLNIESSNEWRLVPHSNECNTQDANQQNSSADSANAALTWKQEDNGDNQPIDPSEVQDNTELDQRSHSDNANDEVSSSSSSNESIELMNTKDAVMMFDKLAKESIQKIMQNDFSESSNDSVNNESQHNIDEIINSDPHQLILNGNYQAKSGTEDVSYHVEQEQLNDQLGEDQELESSSEFLQNDFDKMHIAADKESQDASNSQDSAEGSQSCEDQEPQPAATGNAQKQLREQSDEEQIVSKQKEDYK